MENTMEIRRERDSNFELCRLVCMLYIVIYHLYYRRNNII